MHEALGAACRGKAAPLSAPKRKPAAKQTAKPIAKQTINDVGPGTAAMRSEARSEARSEVSRPGLGATKVLSAQALSPVGRPRGGGGGGVGGARASGAWRGGGEAKGADEPLAVRDGRNASQLAAAAAAGWRRVESHRAAVSTTHLDSTSLRAKGFSSGDAFGSFSSGPVRDDLGANAVGAETVPAQVPSWADELLASMPRRPSWDPIRDPPRKPSASTSQDARAEPASKHGSVKASGNAHSFKAKATSRRRLRSQVGALEVLGGRAAAPPTTRSTRRGKAWKRTVLAQARRRLGAEDVGVAVEDDTREGDGGSGESGDGGGAVAAAVRSAFASGGVGWLQILRVESLWDPATCEASFEATLRDLGLDRQLGAEVGGDGGAGRRGGQRWRNVCGADALDKGYVYTQPDPYRPLVEGHPSLTVAGVSNERESCLSWTHPPFFVCQVSLSQLQACLPPR